MVKTSDVSEELPWAIAIHDVIYFLCRTCA